MRKGKFISTLAFSGIIILTMNGCDIEININPEKQSVEKKTETEVQAAKLLKDEINIEGVRLYDLAHEVVGKLGEPDRTMDDEGGYVYDYDNQGISLIFDEETDEMKGIMVEGGNVKTESGIGMLDEFNEIIGRYDTFNSQGFSGKAVIVTDEQTFLSFLLDEETGVTLMSLMDTKFYEEASGMSLDEYIKEIERISNNTEANGEQPEFEVASDQQDESFEEIYIEQSEVTADTAEESEYSSEQSDYAESEIKYATDVEERNLYAALINSEPSKAIQLLTEYHYDLNYLFSPSGNSSPYFQTTFIHSAAEYSTLEVVQKMVELGANPEILNPDGYPVLFIAISQGKTDIAEYLLDWGSDPSYMGYDSSERNMSNSRTPLILAAEKGNVPLIEQLIYLGADIDQQSNVGETALMFAVNNNQLNAAQTLIVLGADTLIEENTYHHTIFGIPDTNSELSDEMLEWLTSLESEKF